jgi:hypothetical protein
VQTSKAIRVGIFVVMLTAVICEAQTQSKLKRPVKGVTGSYRLTKEEFRNRLEVRQLAGGKIKFHLLALWVSYNNPENIHNGELQGIVALENGVAVYDQDDCKLKFELFPTLIRVTQLNDAGCGFGANVTAAGNYRKLDSKNPKFDF